MTFFVLEMEAKIFHHNMYVVVAIRLVVIGSHKILPPSDHETLDILGLLGSFSVRLGVGGRCFVFDWNVWIFETGWMSDRLQHLALSTGELFSLPGDIVGWRLSPPFSHGRRLSLL